MNPEEFNSNGKRYISSKLASKSTNYTTDYIGQLCRKKKIPAKLIGKTWFIEEESLIRHQRDALLSMRERGRSLPKLNNSNISKESELTEIPRVAEIYKEPVKEKEPSVIETRKVVYEPEKLFSVLPPVDSVKIEARAIDALAEKLAEKLAKKGIKEPAPKLKRKAEWLSPKALPGEIYKPSGKLASLIISLLVAGGIYASANIAATNSLPEVAGKFEQVFTGIADKDNQNLAAISAAKVGNAVGNFFYSAIQGIGGFFTGLFGGEKITVIEPKEISKTESSASSTDNLELPLEDRIASRVVRQLELSGLIVESTSPRIVERIIEKSSLAVSGAVSEERLTQALSQTENALKSEIYRLTSQSGSQGSANSIAIAPVNKIDNLANVAVTRATITNSTFDGSLAGSASLNTISVSGGATFSNLAVIGTGTSTFSGDAAFDSNTLYIDSLNNRVGIGTTSPQYSLDVDGTLRAVSIITGGQTIGGNFSVTGTFDALGLSTLANLLLTGSTTLQNFTFLNATGTSATTTNLFSTNSIFTNSTSTNLFSTNFFTPNLQATTSATLGTTTITNLSVTNSSTSTFAGGLTIAGSGLVYQQATGNVGIGTTSPESKLHIVGSGNPAVSIQGIGAGGVAWLLTSRGDTGQFRITESGVGTYLAIDKTTGNVGIGTTTPLQILHVQKDQNAGSRIRVSNFTDGASADSGIEFMNSAGVAGQILFGAPSRSLDGETLAASALNIITAVGGAPINIATRATQPIRFFTGASGLVAANERMRIDGTTGNVGIGTTTPSQNLTIYDASGGGEIALIGRSSDNQSALFFRNYLDNSNLGYVSTDSNEFRLFGLASTTIYAGGAERVRVGANGNIGIANTNPGKTLDVTGTARISSTVTLGLPTCTGGSALQLNGSSEVICGTVNISGASTGGGWTTNNFPNYGSVTLATTTYSVAIGPTTTPYAKLSIVTDVAATSTLALLPASSQTANIIDIYNTSGALTSVFTSDHKLGIGTTTPTQKLTIAGNADLVTDGGNPLIRIGDTVQDNIFMRWISSGNYGEIRTQQGGGSAGNLVLQTDPAGAGNVGIGTTSPQEKLQVDGNILVGYGKGFEALFSGGGHTVGGSGFFPATTTTLGANDTVVRYASGSNNFQIQHGTVAVLTATGGDLVGIGTTTPLGKLTIASGGGGNSGLTIDNNSASNYSTIDFTQDRTTIVSQITSSGPSFSSGAFGPNELVVANEQTSGTLHLAAIGSSGIIKFTTGGNTTASERMRITSAGNVGIGTTTPNTLLQLASAGPVLSLQDNDSASTSYSVLSHISLYDSSGYEYGWIGDGSGGTNNISLFAGARHNLNLYAGGVERLFIASSTGNVGIGTTSPSNLLHVSGGSIRLDRTNGIPNIALQRLGTAANNNVVAEWAGQGPDSLGNNLNYGYLDVISTDVTDGTEDGAITFTNKVNGTDTETLRLVNGNVGIGTTGNSVYKLAVDSGTSASVFNDIGIGGHGGWFAGEEHTISGYYSNTTAANKLGTISFRYDGGAANTGSIRFQNIYNNGNSSAIAMTIVGDGNVGIGTTTPQSFIDGENRVLAISGNTAPAVTLQSTATAQESTIITDGSGLYIDIAGHATAASNDVIFRTGPTNSSYAVTEAMRINNDGKVAIGTNDPGKLLTLSRATEAASAQLELRNVGGISTGNYDGITFTQGASGATELGHIRVNYLSSGQTDMSFGIRDDANVLYLKDGGNVGIGTTTPPAKLTVSTGTSGAGCVALSQVCIESSGTFAQQSFISPTTGYGYIAFGDSTNNQLGQILYGNTATAATADRNAMIFYTNQSEKVRINSSGFVGIGTDPTTKFHLRETVPATNVELRIGGEADSLIRFTGQANGTTEGFTLKYQNDVGDILFNQIYTGLTTAPAYRFSTGNATDAMVITGSGSVGIGTTSPVAKLSIDTAQTSPTGVGAGVRVSESTGGYGINLGAGTNYGWIQGLLGFQTTLGYNNIALQPNGGNVGIGTTSPAVGVTVNSARTFITNNTNGSAVDPLNSMFAIVSGSDSTYTSPGAMLFVKNAGNRGNIGNVNGSDLFRADFSDASAMIINKSGQVGVGTVSPLEKLHIATDGNLLIESGYLNSPFGGFGRYSNLNYYSEEINQWSLVDTTITPNDTAAPDGATTADRINFSTSGGYLYSPTNISGDANGRTFTLSMWAKVPTTPRSLNMGIYNQVNGAGCIVNGASVTTTWKKFVFSGTCDITTTSFHMLLQGADGTTNPVYVWGVQLEEASTAGVYARTGNTNLASVGRGLVVNSTGPHIFTNGNVEISGGGTFSYPTPGLTQGSMHLRSTGTSGDSAAITFMGNGTTNTSANAGIYVQSSPSYGSKMYLATTDDYGAGSKSRMMIDHFGNVGIGNTSPVASLDIKRTGATGYEVLKINNDQVGNTYGMWSTWQTGGVTRGYIGVTKPVGGTESLFQGELANAMGIRSETNLHLSGGGFVAPTMTLTTAGNVGIGNTDPEGKLHIDKDTTTLTNESLYAIKIEDGSQDVLLALGVSSNNDAAIIQSGDPGTSWTTRPLALQPNGGNVGIGTTTPSAKFSVGGAAGDTTGHGYFTGGLGVGVVNTTEGTIAFKGGSSITTEGGLTRLNLNAATYTYIPSGVFYVQGASHLRGGIDTDSANYLTIAGGTLGYTYFSGNVGAGTTTPGAPLTVSGKSYFSPATGEFVAIQRDSDGPYIGSETNHNFGLITNNTRRIQVTSSGIVGIGTTTPSTTDNSGSLTVGTGASGASGFSGFSMAVIGAAKSNPSSANLYNFYSDPTIDGALTFSTGIYVANPKMASGATLTSNYGIYVADQTRGDVVNIGVRSEISSGSLKYGFYSGGTADNYFNGSVGIGDNSPTEGKLVVAGEIYATFSAANSAALCWDNSGASLITDCTGGPSADYAEFYPTEDGIEYGEIVSLHQTETALISHVFTDKMGNVAASTTHAIPVLTRATKDNALPVIGITSANWGDFSATGHGLVKDEDNPMPIALSGRVPVKVTTEGGAIKIGDRITISSIAGVGAKATTSGQTVGIALENFDPQGGEIGAGTSTPLSVNLPTGESVWQGSILVFVNLGYSKIDGVAEGDTTNDFWTMDQATGRIKSLYPLDLNNQDLTNVKAISSASGKWSIDENGLLTAAEIVTEKLKVTSKSGITIYDEDTDQPMCVKSKSGALTLVPGECSTALIPASSGSVDTGVPPTDTSTTTPTVTDTATTTAETTTPPTEEPAPAATEPAVTETTTPPAEEPTPAPAEPVATDPTPAPAS